MSWFADRRARRAFARDPLYTLRPLISQVVAEFPSPEGHRLRFWPDINEMISTGSHPCTRGSSYASSCTAPSTLRELGSVRKIQELVPLRTAVLDAGSAITTLGATPSLLESYEVILRLFLALLAARRESFRLATELTVACEAVAQRERADRTDVEFVLKVPTSKRFTGFVPAEREHLTRIADARDHQRQRVADLQREISSSCASLAARAAAHERAARLLGDVDAENIAALLERARVNRVLDEHATRDLAELHAHTRTAHAELT